MYAQFALVEHSGNKGSDFCQNVSHLESSANFPKWWEWKAILRGTMLKLTEQQSRKAILSVLAPVWTSFRVFRDS